MKPLLAVAFLVLLAGCSTTLSDRQVEAMSKPTITLDCKTGCTASYTDPRDRMQLPTNGWDVGITAINATAGVVNSTVPWAAIGLTAAKGIENAVGDDNSDDSVTTNNSSREDSRDSSVRTDNSSRVDERDNSARTDNRDNSVRTDNSDNSVRTDNRVDSTHEPTVVTQPEPTVVKPQPAPEE